VAGRHSPPPSHATAIEVAATGADCPTALKDSTLAWVGLMSQRLGGARAAYTPPSRDINFIKAETAERKMNQR
jgi:hypothetical protein